MTKRQKFVLSSILLALGFFGIQYVDFDYRYWSVAGLSLFSLVISLWALKDGLGRNATLLTLVLPVLFTGGTELFFLGLGDSAFFLSLNDIFKTAIRIVLVLGYVIGIYALFLTSNIYNVATARTIQLLRAAHAVGFVLTLATVFFLFNAVLSLRLDYWANGLLMGLISFPLLLQGFWSIELEHKLSRELLYMSGGLSLIAAEIATVLSFWPITVPVGSLALTTIVYVGLGLGQAKLQQRLFDKTVREYLLVGLFVFVIMFFTARW